MVPELQIASICGQEAIFIKCDTDSLCVTIWLVDSSIHITVVTKLSLQPACLVVYEDFWGKCSMYFV